jgi:nifR3 family TIM-barrel protein
MANVTDAAFRRMFVQHGRPDIFWTEFVSVEAILSAGKARALIDLQYGLKEHPIVAQVFGAKPDQFTAAAAIIRKLGFDGIDINMGCPDRAVERQGAGAALIKNPTLAREIIRAAKRGAGSMPVSVKTRIGYARDEIATWIPAILEADVAALTVHLRTRDELSAVAAHWDLAPKIAALRDRSAPKTVILGNGDIRSLADAREKIAASGIDGAMIGRGIFGNPWFFSEKEPSIEERLAAMVAHAALFEKIYLSDNPARRLKGFDVMKKHFTAYASGFPGARDLRTRLMEAETAGDVKNTTDAFLHSLKPDGRRSVTRPAPTKTTPRRSGPRQPKAETVLSQTPPDRRRHRT